MFLMIKIRIVLLWKEREDCYQDGEHQDPLGCQAQSFIFDKEEYLMRLWSSGDMNIFFFFFFLRIFFLIN